MIRAIALAVALILPGAALADDMPGGNWGLMSTGPGGVATGDILLEGYYLGDTTGAADIGGACTPVTTPDATGNACFADEVYVTTALRSGGALMAGTSIAAGAASYFRWTGRSEMYSPADGDIRLTNNIATGFDSLQLGPAAVSDVAPSNVSVLGPNAYSQATGSNQIGGDLYALGGIGTRQVVCDDRTVSDQDVVTLTVDQSVTTLTESTHFDCEGEASEEVCCDNLGAAITTAAIGITPDCATTAGTCYLTPDADLKSFSMGIADSLAGDGAFATMTQGANGQLLISGYPGSSTYPGLGFEGDEDTGIFRYGANTVGISSNGSTVIRVGTSQIDVYKQYDSNGYAVLDSTGALDHGSSCTPTTMADASGNDVFCGAASFEDVATFEAEPQFRAGAEVLSGQILSIGTGGKYDIYYTAGSTQFVLRSTDVDGGGTDGSVFTVQDGTDDVAFNGAITVETYVRSLTTEAGAAAVGGTAPTSQSLVDSAGLVMSRALGFDSTAGEYVTIQECVPSDWDGASDWTLLVKWSNENGDVLQASEDVDWYASVRTVADGESIEGAAATAYTETYTQTGAGTDGELIATSITIDYDDATNPLTVGDCLFINFQRNIGGTESSSYSGDAAIIKWVLQFNSTSLARN